MAPVAQVVKVPGGTGWRGALARPLPCMLGTANASFRAPFLNKELYFFFKACLVKSIFV